LLVDLELLFVAHRTLCDCERDRMKEGATGTREE